MREVVEDCEFNNGERVTLYRQYDEKFIVRASVNKGLIMKEITFYKFKEAEDFYDTFIEGKNVKTFLNEMLKEIHSEGKYQVNFL